MKTTCNMKHNFVWLLTSLMLIGLLVLVSMSLAEEGTWAKKADMQTPRKHFSTCAMDDKIYAIGGLPEGKGGGRPALSSVERYDPKTNRWINVADMPLARWGHTANAVDGKIYVIGGDNVTGLPVRVVSVFEYDAANDEWSVKGNTPIGFFFHCSVVVNGMIYVIGGAETIGVDLAVSTVFEYNPKTDTWTQKADMPTARFSAAATVVDGKIYVMGGGTPQFKWPWNLLSTLEVYDPTTDTWTKNADMPTSRDSASASTVEGKIYVLGGGDEEEELSIMEKYEPETDTWERMADMPTPRYLLCTSVVDGRIYAIGGYGLGAKKNLSTVEEYTPEGWPFSVSPQGKLPTTWGEIKQK